MLASVLAIIDVVLLRVYLPGCTNTSVELHIVTTYSEGEAAYDHLGSGAQNEVMFECIASGSATRGDMDLLIY
jgi:hypothetical protein